SNIPLLQMEDSFPDVLPAVEPALATAKPDIEHEESTMTVSEPVIDPKETSVDSLDTTTGVFNLEENVPNGVNSHLETQEAVAVNGLDGPIGLGAIENAVSSSNESPLQSSP